MPMTPEEKKFRKDLREKKEAASHAREAFHEARNRMHALEQEVRDFTRTCPGTTGVKYRHSVVSRHPTSGRFFKCEVCEDYHEVTREEWDKMPGPVKTLYNGN